MDGPARGRELAAKHEPYGRSAKTKFRRETGRGAEVGRGGGGEGIADIISRASPRQYLGNVWDN